MLEKLTWRKPKIVWWRDTCKTATITNSVTGAKMTTTSKCFNSAMRTQIKMSHRQSKDKHITGDVVHLTSDHQHHHVVADRLWTARWQWFQLHVCRWYQWSSPAAAAHRAPAAAADAVDSNSIHSSMWLTDQQTAAQSDSPNWWLKLTSTQSCDITTKSEELG